MRRLSLFLAAAAIAASGSAIARPAHAPFYVIRWDNTGICQIWNDELKYQPARWPSDYKVVSRHVPTLEAAMAVQAKLRTERHCFL